MPTALKRFLRITPQQLRAFEATARLLSMTQAAKELHVTQPTISVQLRELADKVGEPLFEIAEGSLKLTRVGEILAQTQTSIGNLWLNFEIQLEELRSKAKLHLHVCAQSGAENFLPRWLSRFEAAHPEVELDFTVCSRETSLQQLNSGACDIAILEHGLYETVFECKTFHTAQKVVIAHTRHRLAGAVDAVELSELQAERWLVNCDAVTLPGLNPLRLMRLDSYDAIRQSVAAGLGVAVVPAGETQCVTHPGIAELRIHGFPILQSWNCVWSKNRAPSPLARAFMEAFA